MSEILKNIKKTIKRSDAGTTTSGEMHKSLVDALIYIGVTLVKLQTREAENKQLKKRLKNCTCPDCGFGFEQALKGKV